MPELFPEYYGQSLGEHFQRIVFGTAMAPLTIVSPWFWHDVASGNLSRADYLEHAAYTTIWVGAASAVALYTGVALAPLEAYGFYASWGAHHAGTIGLVAAGLVGLGVAYSEASSAVGGFASPAASGMGVSPGTTDYGPFGRHFR